MSLIRWSNKQRDPMIDLWGLDDPLFGLSMFPFSGKAGDVFARGWAPAVDVSENEQEFIVKADLPGIKKEKIQVFWAEGVLTIKGKRKYERDEKRKDSHCVERSFGSFERSIKVGNAVKADKVRASYKNGVLELVLPKSEQSRTKRIDVE